MLYNLREYHRPVDLDEALALLQRSDVKTVSLAGGTAIIGGDQRRTIEAVVDLATLELDEIVQDNNTLTIGAMVTLQRIIEELSDTANGLLALAAQRMAGWNIRNQATLGGTLGAGKRHSPLSVALATLGAQVTITGQEDPIPWSNVTSAMLTRQIVTDIIITIPDGEMGTAYEQVGRTPADSPIVCAASATIRLSDTQISTRTIIGGILAESLYPVDFAIDETAQQSTSMRDLINFPEDAAFLSNHLGSSDYRRQIAPVLAQRALSGALLKLGINVT